MKNDTTEEYRLLQIGIEYNKRINLYDNVDKNERFYIGDQWKGVENQGYPTPVLNILKRVINYMIASIMSQNISMKFIAENVGDEPQNQAEADIKEYAENVSLYSETLFEKLKINHKSRQWLLDTFLSGDACAYNFWDMDIENGSLIKGDIGLETVDNVNVFFGNPNDNKVESQPYILLQFRELVSKLKKRSKRKRNV